MEASLKQLLQRLDNVASRLEAVEQKIGYTALGCCLKNVAFTYKFVEVEVAQLELPRPLLVPQVNLEHDLFRTLIPLSLKP